MLPNTVKEKLKERVKELECLYAISVIINGDQKGIAATMEAIVQCMKKAWRFSDDAIVELVLDGFHILTADLPAETVFQEIRLKTFNKQFGFVKVHYPAARFTQKHFLNEESVLLKEIGNMISAYYEKHLNTEREAVVKQNAERVDRLSILAEITAGIAHEINTPLGNILGFAELLSKKNMDAQSLQDIKKIRSAAIYSREIVKKLMFFSCEMPHTIELLEVKPNIIQVLSFLEHKFNKEDVHYKLIVKDPALRAQLDTIQFTQILFNLLLNALYVAPKGSTIVIEVADDSTNFYITISDNGPGVPDAIKKSIFEPFFTTKPLGEGTGLGLSVVHGIVKSLRGEITVTNNKPHGAVFKITLPIYHNTL